jgi:NMD protein affecting ribosome stability and mRNA decay
MKRERGGFRILRHKRVLQDLVHDTYKAKGKLCEPTRCPDCGAVFRRGRWSWATAQPGAQAARCPACRRIHEHLPAGFVNLRGEFFKAHRDEILQRVRHCEQSEKADHPLERIIDIRANGISMLITTTGTHLARRLGEAIKHAYKGALEFRYNRQENLLRVSWLR